MGSRFTSFKFQRCTNYQFYGHIYITPRRYHCVCSHRQFDGRKRVAGGRYPRWPRLGFRSCKQCDLLIKQVKLALLLILILYSFSILLRLRNLTGFLSFLLFSSFSCYSHLESARQLRWREVSSLSFAISFQPGSAGWLLQLCVSVAYYLGWCMSPRYVSNWHSFLNHVELMIIFTAFLF